MVVDPVADPLDCPGGGIAGTTAADAPFGAGIAPADAALGTGTGVAGDGFVGVINHTFVDVVSAGVVFLFPKIGVDLVLKVSEISREVCNVAGGVVQILVEQEQFIGEVGGLDEIEIGLHLAHDPCDVFLPVDLAGITAAAQIPGLAPGDAAYVIAVVRVTDHARIAAADDNAL